MSPKHLRLAIYILRKQVYKNKDMKNVFGGKCVVISMFNAFRDVFFTVFDFITFNKSLAITSQVK